MSLKNDVDFDKLFKEVEYDKCKPLIIGRPDDLTLKIGNNDKITHWDGVKIK